MACAKDLGSVWVVNPVEENLNRLPDIRAGREKAQTVLDNFARMTPDDSEVTALD